MKSASNPQSNANPASTALPVIDPAVIDELKSVGGSDQLLQRVLSLFSLHVPKSLELIRQHAVAGELGELADTVHALKSMCGNIGAKKATARCEEIEVLARSGQPFDRASLIKALSEEVDEALREAERLKSH